MQAGFLEPIDLPQQRDRLNLEQRRQRDLTDAFVARQMHQHPRLRERQTEFGRGRAKVLALHPADVGDEKSERRIGLRLVTVGHGDSPELRLRT